MNAVGGKNSGGVWNARGARNVGSACRDGAVVRALASHQCGPGSIPGFGVIRVEFEVEAACLPLLTLLGMHVRTNRSVNDVSIVTTAVADWG